MSNKIKEKIYEVGGQKIVSNGMLPDIVVIELGGTVGDIESSIFYESVR